MFGLLLLVAVLEMVPLGPRFNAYLAVSLLASALADLLLAIWLVWSPSRYRETLSRRAGVLLVGGGMLLVVCILVGVLVGSQMLERRARAADAEAAHQRFVIPNTSRFPADDVERALAEFERAARRLEGLWPSMEGRDPVVLELYPNLEVYRTEMGLQWSRGSVECREHETVISVPLEDASGIMTGGRIRRQRHCMRWFMRWCVKAWAPRRCSRSPVGTMRAWLNYTQSEESLG